MKLRTISLPLLAALSLGIIFGLLFSYRAWQFCCGEFSAWSPFNLTTFFPLLESAIFGFAAFFLIFSFPINRWFKLFYISYFFAALLLESPYRFYATSFTFIFAAGHLAYLTYKNGYKKELTAFAILTALTFLFFPWMTPFHYSTGAEYDIRMFNSNLPLLQPIYKGFISAKFLNFSSIDYAYFASAISIPIGNSAFFLQVMGYAFDIPSISTEGFFALVNFTGLALFSIGAFSTYILFKNYLKSSTSIAWMAALTLFILNRFLIDVYSNDNWMFISCYALIPLALIAAIRIMENKKNSIIFAAFILGLPFALIGPHPNYYITLILTFFIIGTFFAAEKNTEFRGFIEKLFQLAFAFALSLIFSAHYLIPIIKQHLAWDCHIIPHHDYHCFRHCNREIFIALFAFIITAILSIRQKKIALGLYFTSALLLLTFLLKKTILLDFAMGKIVGGAIARLPLFLWFISFFTIFYYGRKLNDKRLNAAFGIIAILTLGFFTQRYLPDISQTFHAKDSYHISADTKLANLPALKADKSNLDHLKKPIVEAQNVDWEKFHSAISPYNTSLIYKDLKPFSRIESATRNDFQIGSAPGLLLNNNSTGFDPRYMTGYIPTEFLYIMKDYVYAFWKGDGGVESYHTYPWNNFDPLHEKTKRLMNIAGIDYVTAKTALPTLEKVKSFSLFGSQYHLYKNPASYGVAYIANIRGFYELDEVTKIKETARGYIKDTVSYHDYVSVMQKYENQLFALKGKYNALVSDSNLKSGKGSAEIKEMVGNRVIVESDCKDKECFLALNFSHLPQWKAYTQDFSPLEIHDVNFAFMGVSVPQGKNQIMFTYLSWLNEIAAIASLLAFAFFLIMREAKK